MPSRPVLFSRISRAIALLLAVFALLALTGRDWAVILLPGLSPYVMLISAISLRSFTWISLLAIPVVFLSFWRGRWFCRYVCPSGLCFEAAGRLGQLVGVASRRPLRFRPNTILLLLATGSAAVGFPLFLWLDPLTLMNGFVGVWTVPFSWGNAALGSGFALLLALSFILPHQWCFGICPLGSVQQWLGNAGRRLRSRRPPAEKPDAPECPGFSPSRRTALALITGGILGLTFRRTLKRHPVIRPPGSVPEHLFNALCTRCGNCMRVCPQHLLHPAGIQAGIDGLLTPVIRMRPGYCSEFCNRCNTVCPSGAIAILTLNKKRQIAIGTAVIQQNLCLAWNDAQYCMVCDEFCPFSAIHTEEHQGVNCPVVDSEICRGCGLCQKECPALQVAITVESRPQRLLTHVPL